ncbi:hypothetical protein AVEN_150609-1 [Araneus ventricosus]|uniref:Uncharacterized protein n=1 Tax=Araneus ventricosus TaxID=182803 RepID=A0A4Y2GLJ0_ARAVE|nr:hypothetical protein AVEN_150609-1 [Araneus ventricosus]
MEVTRHFVGGEEEGYEKGDTLKLKLEGEEKEEKRARRLEEKEKDFGIYVTKTLSCSSIWTHRVNEPSCSDAEQHFLVPKSRKRINRYFPQEESLVHCKDIPELTANLPSTTDHNLSQ